MKGSSPVVELTLPVLPDMELAATKTAEVVAKHMDLSDEKSAEISMALIEACINAFEHSGTNKQIEIHFRIKEDVLEIQVTDRGKGFDESKVNIPKIEEKIVSDRKRGWGLQLIKELMDKELKNDINNNKTELMIRLMIMAAIYEFMFMHKTPVKVVISEYLKVSDFFVADSQKSFLNAILDKIAKISRLNKE